ncbi:11460_t:CDS:2 [Gigaspora margarita]|uniref:11460_t:CDS:1 n=1 Tax=Gigaspora margarita TaxID=4874 RepID=A0ABN7VBP0_GIGMA|nr:11460_t:CDS:2 [Gigaspora margarita]
MTYNTEELERQFKNLGGSHNLHEDCETLTKSFNKMESLREIKEELKKCTNKSEYDAKKKNYIRKCEESLRGLKEKTTSSSMFGICIIWSDEGMNKHVISKLNSFCGDLEKLKSDLEREDYKWIQELKQLQLEEKEINRRIEENKRKAMNEKDPAQKALLLQMIDEDGKKLKANLKKQQELSKKFNFDPNKRIDDLIKAIKDAIEGNSGGGGSGSGGSGRNRNRGNNDDESDDNNDDPDNSGGGSEEIKTKLGETTEKVEAKVKELSPYYTNLEP